MTRLCTTDFRLDGLPFAAGTEYTVEFNPVYKQLYIYTVWGFTTISTEILNRNFV